MAAVRLQEFEHPLVGPSPLARQRPRHDVRQVVVAHRDGVWIAERHERDFSGSPRPHPGQGGQAKARGVQWHIHGFFQPRRMLRGAADRLGAAPGNTVSMEHEIRRGHQACGFRRHKEASMGRGRRLAEIANERSPTLPRLGPWHHLLQDARHGSLEDSLASRDPEPGMEAPELPDQWVLRLEV